MTKLQSTKHKVHQTPGNSESSTDFSNIPLRSIDTSRELVKMDAHRNGYDSFYTAGVNKMGGPIVRTGTTPKFWENYDKIFSDKPGTKTKKKTASKTTKKKPAQAKKKK